MTRALTKNLHHSQKNLQNHPFHPFRLNHLPIFFVEVPCVHLIIIIIISISISISISGVAPSSPHPEACEITAKENFQVRRVICVGRLKGTPYEAQTKCPVVTGRGGVVRFPYKGWGWV